jgi:iron(III) transport system ATP-binding protein
LSPGLLLLDEPLSALDAPVRARLRGELRVPQLLGITTILATHDQEEALTMADRIVVMRQGRIDQIGAPAQIYACPATPFVAGFIGKMNFFAGTMLAADRLHVAEAELACTPQLDAFGVNTTVTVCLRPEDVVLGNVHNGATNVFEAQVGVIEFIGSHFTAILHVVSASLNVSADLSINDVRDLGIASGKKIRIGLPPERLHVFPQVAGS